MRVSDKGDSEMVDDTPPLDTEVLALIDGAGGKIEPDALIKRLMEEHTGGAVIEALQRAIERGKISLDPDGMVVPAQALAYAA